MGDVYWSVHAPLVARVSRQLGITTAIETGTYFGVGTLQLAGLFESVWTIENDPVLAEFFEKNYGHVKNVRMRLGQSANVLKEILPSLSREVLFFLDAHWFASSSRSSFLEGRQCPLLEELRAIRECLRWRRGSVIMVDDADMFLKSLQPPFNSEEFPRIGELMKEMKHSVDAEFVDVMDDVVIAGPRIVRQLLEEYETDRRTAGAPYVRR